ncbi:MAG: ABC transporter permease [Planctomycetes bacterium]|nr:ABC transporter permease [Planctomycetota bacterium]
MARLVPLSYNLRSLFVRKSATLLTVVSVGATVAVIAGVLSLQQGFVTLFAEGGRQDLVLFLRPGSVSEGNSGFAKERADTLIKETPEIAEDAQGRPLASAETYLAVRLFKTTGGETNVAIRGVQPMTFELRRDDLRYLEGRELRPGTDEVIVGANLVDRIRGCQVGATVQLNTVPFTVVGVFDDDGPYASEIWGDLDRMVDALERPVYNRVIAKLRDGVDLAAFKLAREDNERVPATVMTEREYLASQKGAMGVVLAALASFLGLIMGLAAIFTTTTTMLAALASRTHEIGILGSLGFRPFAIFLAFMTESLLLGILGGLAGWVMTLPLNGIETGTMNFQTFTEVAFAFRVTPVVLGISIVFAIGLGLVGGALPAWRAARMRPVDALRD